MNEFKFNCSKCGQHILANASWIGRRLNCPSCDTRITVPAPPKPPKKKEPVGSAAAGTNAKLPGATVPVKPPVKADKTSPAPAKAPEKSEPATIAPAVAKFKPPGATVPMEPPAKTAKTETVPAKAPKETEAAAVAPAAAKATPPTPVVRVEPPVKTDRTADPPVKVPQQTEPVAAAPPEVKVKPPGATLRVEPPIKTDKAETAPAKAPEKIEPTIVAPAVEKAKAATPTLRVEPPVKADKTDAAPAPTPQPAPEVADAVKTEATPPQPESGAVPDAAKPPEQPRVAVLTPAVKLEMVGAVRHRIAEESAWLPGNVEGTAAYAAKMSEGKPVLLDATSSEATRFSLMGAFLLEMHVRQVITVATGRKKFLDEEIPEAIREVLLEQMDDEERERGEDSLTDKDLLSISHAQCLAALDVLEERYSQRVDQLRIEKAKKRLGNERLPDLVKKLDKKARILPEDVATALYHELMDVRRRLERLESRLSQNK